MFQDDVSNGLKILKSESNGKWKLGDIASKYAPAVEQGHHADDNPEPTLSDLAREWDVLLPRVVEWRLCAMFYPERVRIRESYNVLSWYHFNAARKYGGNGSHASQLENVEELLLTAVAQHLSVEQFKDYLKQAFPKPDKPEQVEDALDSVLPADYGTDSYYERVRNGGTVVSQSQEITRVGTIPEILRELAALMLSWGTTDMIEIRYRKRR